MCVLECTLAATMHQTGQLKLVVHDVLIWDGRCVVHTLSFLERFDLTTGFIDDENENTVPTIHAQPLALVRSHFFGVQESLPACVLAPEVGQAGDVDYESRGIVVIPSDPRPAPQECHPAFHVAVLFLC
jgi:hypothetical protein